MILLTWSRNSVLWMVEVAVAGELGDREEARLRRRLAGRSLVVRGEDAGHVLRFHVEGEELDSVVEQALRLITVRAPLRRLSAITAEEYSRQLQHPQLPDLVGIVDIQKMAGLNNKQRAHQLTGLTGFPGPAIETRAGRLWTKTAVERFLATWPRRMGRPPKTDAS